MEKYVTAFTDSFLSTLDWTWKSIIFDVPWYTNFFWGLVVISLAVWVLEIVFPWRKNQSIFRKDFWLDGFYMFFNFFIFAIMISGVYELLGVLFGEFGISKDTFIVYNEFKNLPMWVQLVVFFILVDFVQWFTHVLLHRYDILWRFHKVHHSVKEMGFAAHLRYHWMENLFYKPLKTLVPLLLLGQEPAQAYIVHFIAITIGHLNHANIKASWGPFKYIINNPVMHLYHHVKALPSDRRYGINFGISLSLWDYIFKTNYVPEDSGTIELGFPEDEKFPKTFSTQVFYGFGKNK